MSYNNVHIQKDVDQIIKERAEKLGISLEQAYELYRSPFVFMIHNWAKAEKDNAKTFESTYIKSLGVFYPKVHFIEKLREIHGLTDNGE